LIVGKVKVLGEDDSANIDVVGEGVPSFAVVFSVGKEEATGEDDSANIDVANEEGVLVTLDVGVLFVGRGLVGVETFEEMLVKT